jgi:hypothetical protein
MGQDKQGRYNMGGSWQEAQSNPRMGPEWTYSRGASRGSRSSMYKVYIGIMIQLIWKEKIEMLWITHILHCLCLIIYLLYSLYNSFFTLIIYFLYSLYNSFSSLIIFSAGYKKSMTSMSLFLNLALSRTSNICYMSIMYDVIIFSWLQLEYYLQTLLHEEGLPLGIL